MKIDRRYSYVLFQCLLCAALLVGLLAGCKNPKTGTLVVPPDAQAGDIVNLMPCIYERGGVEYMADCGTLVVPENRSVSDSRLIAIPVTRIHSTGSQGLEPIFFLPGGPGLSNNGTSRVNWFIDNHDVVIVGYRGVDGSVHLDCPEVSSHIKNLPGDMLGAESIQSMTSAYAECAARLQNAGIDLAGYSMVEVVDDLEAARIGFGYVKLNMYSISYGTRLAMLYAWRYPEQVNRSAMFAINPPGHMFYYDPEVIDQQLADYAALCASDPQCSTRTDDLAETMRRVSQNMPKRWLGLPIDHGMIRAASFESLAETQSAAKVFDVWLAADNGDYSGMVLLSLIGPMMFADATVWGDNIAKASGADFVATQALRAEMNLSDSILGSPRSELAQAAAGWPINTIPEAYQVVQSSDVETLLVSGSIDLWTPLRFAEEEFLPSLTHGYHVVVSDNGHGEMLSRQPEACARLLTHFFATGKVDDSLFVYQPWVYEVGLGFPALAKIVVAAILVVITTLIFVLRSLINKKIRS